MTNKTLPGRIASLVLAFSFLLAAGGCGAGPGPVAQVAVPRVDAMPDSPPQFRMKDWKELALAFDAFAYAPGNLGIPEPFAGWDRNRRNFDEDLYGLLAYLGDNRSIEAGQHEAITTMAALVSATLVGIDKSDQDGLDYVSMVRNYYNKANGETVFLDMTNTVTGHSFWYEIFPNILFFMLYDLYPDTPGFEALARSVADSWYEAARVMCDGGKTPNFGYNSFRFSDRTPVSDRWMENDAGAGIAWLLYMAHVRFGDEKYLEAARWGLDFTQGLQENPFYEVLLPYGVTTAARMNAEQGTDYNLDRLLRWCFEMDGMAQRPITVTVGQWGDFAVDGLMAFFSDGKEYAFYMDTVNLMAALAPMVRYDQRYARAIGKWLLHASNNARLFFVDEIPAGNQNCMDVLEWNPGYTVPYEGLRSEWAGVKPMAMGDPRSLGWGQTNFAVYSGAFTGFLGGLVQRTDVERILRIDLDRLDFFRDASYPTWLCYNPYDETRTITLSLAEGKRSVYDTVSRRFLVRNTAGTARIPIPAGQAVVLVDTPADGVRSLDGTILTVDGIAVDYHAVDPAE